MRSAVAAGALGLALAAAGLLLDARASLPQPLLWAGLQAASLGGASLGAAAVLRRLRGGARRALVAAGALLAWRLAYFPVMVFSGQVAGASEWALRGLGLPASVWPAYLVAVAALHAAAVVAMAALLVPPRRALALGAALAFGVAAAVSFLRPADLTLLPDRALRLEAPVPEPSPPRANPYLSAFGDAGYAPHQRVILLAAGLTYAAIPPSPWARSVKGTLEALFRERPHASTHERVREHYRAYHAAQRRLARPQAAPEPHAP